MGVMERPVVDEWGYRSPRTSKYSKTDVSEIVHSTLWFPKPQVVLDLGFDLWLGCQTDPSPGQKIEPPLPGELYSDCGFFLFQF